MRSYIASKVSEQFNHSQFTPNEAKIAIEIFRLLLRDTSSMVRKAIAENLKRNHQVPRDVVLALANDTAEIAMPVLEFSMLLNDEDLLEIIRSTREVRKWLAISRRHNLSAKVSRQLVATRSEIVVVSLLGNSDADIGDADLEYLLNEFRHEQDILESLVFRGGMNVRLAEKLHSLVSTQLKKQLTKKFRLPWNMVSQEADLQRESAMLRFLTLWMSEEETVLLVQQMHKNKRLSISLTLRALAQGEKQFFDAALATRADVSQDSARKLLLDRGPLGFRTLCTAAGVPANFVDALDAIYRYVQQSPRNEHVDSATYTQQLLDYIRAHRYDQLVTNMNAVINFITAADHELRTIH
ncbi:MAG: DUF2336 domain-containing protein [Rickettsiales bacterium]|nr:DUF2336 domain-containing protein [Rickettsiales bacterium]